jgi:hypothetical protein
MQEVSDTTDMCPGGAYVEIRAACGRVWKSHLHGSCSLSFGAACRCTLRMDHHCVVLGNCVGLYNWKYFISAYVYLFLSSVNGLIIMAVRFIAQPEFTPDTPERMHCAIFTVMCAFLAWTGYKHANMHLNLAMLNLTSIEYMGLPAYLSLNFCQRYGIAWSRISNYDKGWRHNLIMILGEPVITWFMPWVAPRSPWGPNPVTCQSTRRHSSGGRDLTQHTHSCIRAQTDLALTVLCVLLLSGYSGFNLRELYGPPAPSAPRSGPQVNAHNHDVSASRNGWNMYDEPVQHAADGLRASNLQGKGSMPLIAFQDANGSTHHGDEAHAHGGPTEMHAHGPGMDDMPGLLSDEDIMEMGHGHGGHNHAGHNHAGHNHGSGGGGGHNHSHGGGGGHNHAH